MIESYNKIAKQNSSLAIPFGRMLATTWGHGSQYLMPAMDCNVVVPNSVGSFLEAEVVLAPPVVSNGMTFTFPAENKVCGIACWAS